MLDRDLATHLGRFGPAMPALALLWSLALPLRLVAYVVDEYILTRSDGSRRFDQHEDR